MTHSINPQADGSYRFVSREAFTFESGSTITPLELVYETFGTLNDGKDNAIIVHHALSTNSHVTSSGKNPASGWWQDMVGPGRPLDTDRYCIICINNLGSCFGSSGPASLNPGNNLPYGMDFPPVTITDMVRSQKILTDALGIEQLYAVVGNSMGAMLSLTWLSLFPDHARHLISVSSCAQSYPANNANRMLQKEIIRMDPNWRQGRYRAGDDLRGFRTARKLGLLTYRNWAELNERFLDKHGDASIFNYLEYNAEKFTRSFDCNSYLYLLDAMDCFDLKLGATSLVERLRPIQAKTLVVSVDSDILFTPSQQQDLYQYLLDAGVDATYIDHHSTFGHDAFLVEIDAFGSYISDFLDHKLR